MAANYTQHEELLSELQCSVCRDTYTDPVDLTCSHAFCRSCLLATFRANVGDHIERRSYVDCPICRKRNFTTEANIKKMPLNLKLRNIVSAIGDGHTKEKPLTCDVHSKAYVIFCHDCDSLKCLSCLLKTNCSSHKTEEVEEIVSKIRKEILEKQKTITAKREEMLKHKEGAHGMLLEIHSAFIPRLYFVADKLHRHRLDVIGTEQTTLENHEEKLNVGKSLSDSEIVAQRATIVDSFSDYVDSDKLAAVNKAFDELKATLTGATDKMKAFLEEQGVVVDDRVEAEEPSANVEESDTDWPEFDEDRIAGSVSRGSSSPYDTAYYGYVGGPADYQFEHDYSLFQAALDGDTDAGEALFLRYHDEEGNSINSDNIGLSMGMSGESSPTAGSDSLSPVLLHRMQFVDTMANTVSCLNRDFIVNNSDGGTAMRLDESILHGVAVESCCVITPAKVLVLFSSGTIEVHSYGALMTNVNNPVYRLPVPPAANMKLECIGVSGPEPLNYLFSDYLNSYIHVWHSEYRRWCDPIEVGSLCLQHRPSFKMCVFMDKVFITFHQHGKVCCVNLQGDPLWSNNINLVRPNGITADASGVYVCEGEINSHSVVVFTLSGTVLRNILLGLVNHPWSIAVKDGRLAVLEKRYRHRLEISPICALLFDIRAIMGQTYEGDMH